MDEIIFTLGALGCLFGFTAWIHAKTTRDILFSKCEFLRTEIVRLQIELDEVKNG